MSVGVILRSPLSRWLSLGSLLALAQVFTAHADPPPAPTESDENGWEGDLDAIPSSDPSQNQNGSAPPSTGAAVAAAGEAPKGKTPSESQAKAPSAPVKTPGETTKPSSAPVRAAPSSDQARAPGEPAKASNEPARATSEPSRALREGRPLREVSPRRTAQKSAAPAPYEPAPAEPATDPKLTDTADGVFIDPQPAPTTLRPAPGAALPSARLAAMTRALPSPSLRPEQVMRRQAEYLQQRFDLAARTHPTLKMSGGRKAVPVGPTARLPAGLNWEQLSRMTSAEIKQRGIFPYEPLWHPLQEVGGMVFPAVQTSAVSGLERTDVWFDLPDAYLPEFPAPLYLTSRPDLGDVSQGQLITPENADLLFRDVLTPTQLAGLKAMLERHPAQRHNGTDDRSTAEPSSGVACMDCHVNGHTTAQFSLTPDLRPQSECFRVDTASLRGTFVQSWFGKKRALRTLEQFIVTEPRALYFDGDVDAAERKGGHDLDEEEVEAIAQFTRLIDFPPAPKLNARGGLEPKKSVQAELRGEKLFGQHCAGCHPKPWFTDNQAHDLKVERFYDLHGSTRSGAPGRAEGAMKTPSLRGLKDSPPYLHDGRLLTLEDAVEFFNIVLQARLNKAQRADLVEYLRAL